MNPRGQREPMKKESHQASGPHCIFLEQVTTCLTYQPINLNPRIQGFEKKIASELPDITTKSSSLILSSEAYLRQPERGMASLSNTTTHMGASLLVRCQNLGHLGRCGGQHTSTGSSPICSTVEAQSLETGRALRDAIRTRFTIHRAFFWSTDSIITNYLV